jgi:hypothetical protein
MKRLPATALDLPPLCPVEDILAVASSFSKAAISSVFDLYRTVASPIVTSSLLSAKAVRKAAICSVIDVVVAMPIRKCRIVRN